MFDLHGLDLHLDQLSSEVERLRKALAPLAPVVAVASVRSRDRSEATHGVVVPFGLASSLLFDPQFGEYAAMDRPRFYLFEGTLSGRHIASLIPVFEQIARDRAPLLIAASEVDEDVLAMVSLNKQRGTARGAVLLPVPRSHPASIGELRRLTGAGVGEAPAGGDLRVEQPGSPLRVISTLFETMILGAPKHASDLPSLGIVYVGGEDIQAARLRARAAREMIARGGLR